MLGVGEGRLLDANYLLSLLVCFGVYVGYAPYQEVEIWCDSQQSGDEDGACLALCGNRKSAAGSRRHTSRKC